MQPLRQQNTERSTGLGVKGNVPQDRALLEVAFAQATAHARLGEYVAAEKILDRLGQEEGIRRRACDLRARILAQQGRLDDAERMWQELLRLEPEAVAGRDALQRIHRLRKPGFPFVKAGVILIVCAALAVGVIMAVRHEKQIRDKVAVGSVSSTPPDAGRSNGSSTGSDLAARLQTEGVHVNLSGREAVVQFDRGLFVRGKTFMPGAKRVLTAVARVLSRVPDTAIIVISGCSDNLPLRAGSPYKGPAQLRLQRAQTVGRYLIKHGGIPQKDISYQDSCWVPSPNTLSSSGIKNRTVVVRVFDAEPRRTSRNER